MSQRILVIGATSAIAEAWARRCAARGDQIDLLARNAERLATIAADLSVRVAQRVDSAVVDLGQIEALEPALEHARSNLGGLDQTLIAHGTLPDQVQCWESCETTLEALHINAVSTIALMTLLATMLETQGSGTLAVISSVAGDRGRASNAIYGSAKAAVSSYASALRQRLARSGVNVLTIKPGFVDTPMTANIRKGALWAQPDQIAAGIDKAIQRRRSVVYLPRFWSMIMLVIKTIPETVFRRLRF